MTLARRIVLLFTLMALAVCAPALAQTGRPAAASATPTLSFRPFFMAAGEQFAASKTFNAVLGEQALRPFWGGGVEIDVHKVIFVEVSASRFKQSGQRAFVVDGRVLPVGIPLTTTITPLEIIGGYRSEVTKRVIAYAGVGVGWYKYQETSTFNDTGEDIDQSHSGFAAVGGVEIKVHQWVGVAVDAHYAHVGGILGTAGVSQAFAEDDLGGTSLRVRILVGR